MSYGVGAFDPNFQTHYDSAWADCQVELGVSITRQRLGIPALA